MAILEAIPHFEIPNETGRTPGAFLATNDWGTKKGQADVEFVWLWYRGADRYGDVEARNPEHTHDLLWYGNHLADLYEETFPDKPPVNRKVLNGGIIYHDTGETEGEAAANFREDAPELGYTEAETMRVEGVIRSSAADIEPSTIEEVIMNIADLHTVGEDRNIYKSRGQLYEAEERHKLGVAFKEWQYVYKNTRRLTKFVMKNNLDLYGLMAPWLDCARENVRADIKEIAQAQHQKLEKVVRRIGGNAIQLFEGQFSNYDDPYQY